MNTQLTTHNSLRFSLTSCATEDSADSASVATPLDVSPCPQRNTGFPIINPTEHESPYLTRYQIPDVAAVVGRHRHRQHGTLSPLPRSIRIVQTLDLSPPSLSQRLLTTNSMEQTAQRQQEQESEQGQDQEQPKEPSVSQHHPEQQHTHHPIFSWPRVKRILPRSSHSSSASSSSSSLSSTNHHHQHMRKKPSTSRGVMSHLSSLICNSMRLANSMGSTDQPLQQHQQQKSDRTTSSSSAPQLAIHPSQKKKPAQTTTLRWFGKHKSRISPHTGQ